jgi:3',5'-cyclic AMP phosphodiesterase CpdA
MSETPATGPVLARFDRPRSSTRTRSGVVADAHVTPTGSGTRKTPTGARAVSGPRSGVDADVDATVLVGDLTRDGTPAEFDHIDEIIANLDAPWTAVPGNYDVPETWGDHATPPV